MNINLEVLILSFLASSPALITSLYGILTIRADNKKRAAETTKTTTEAKKIEKDAKKTDIEATDVLTDIALSMVKPLQDENARLEKRLLECEKGVHECKTAKKEFIKNFEELWRGAYMLHGQLTELEQTPKFALPPYPENGVITKPLPKRKPKSKNGEAP